MTRRARGWPALLIGSLIAACSAAGSEPTQVVVVIDAEPEVRELAAEMSITVRSVPDGNAVYERMLLAAQNEIVLPYVLALVPKGGDASRRFEVVATVQDQQRAFVAQVRAIGGYVAHRRVVLWLVLEDSCQRMDCPGEDQTCRNGVCESAVVDPGSLDPLDDVDLPDAGPIGTDEPDGGAAGTAEAGSDAATSGTGGNAAGRGGTGGSGGAGTGAGSGGDPGCEDGAWQLCGTTLGECSPGLQTCSDGEWGECAGHVEASAEVCDAQDDDCDGETDEDAPCDLAGLSHAVRAGCVQGTCRAVQCDLQWGDCNSSRSDGCEQSLNSLAHCAGCGNPCALANAAESCATGACLVTACDTGWDDCDQNGTSCETQLGTVDACSGCGDACRYENASAECADNGGVRSCRFVGCSSARYASCDDMDATGCEIDLHTNPQHCGECDYDCANRPNVQSAACAGGACAFECAPDFIDCDGDPDNGCEHAYSTTGLCSRCFESGTSNFAASTYAYTDAVAFNCGGTHTFDSTTQTWDTTCCGVCPAVTGPIAQTAAGGPQVVILRAAQLQVASGTTVRLVGQYPVILAIQGDASIAGVIDASAEGTTPGAGGNWSCGGAQGQNGSGSCGDIGESGAGGGGGGFGTAGGRGGDVDDGTPGSGGASRGNASLSPLFGGCRGGNAGGSNATGAAGGGAVQISAAGTLTITGTVRANGGDGVTPIDCGDGGGTGGGSGGSILLEGVILNVGGTLQARGGSGGRGEESGYMVDPAGNGGSGSTAPGSAGGNGGDGGDSGGGGGGGGYGRIRVRDCLGP